MAFTEQEWRAGFDRPSDVEFRQLLDKLPAAAYTTDADGLITYFNQRGVELWGREPKLHDPADRYCGSFKLFDLHGEPIPHERCWMALALRDDRAYNAEEIIVERQDGSRVTALAHANPIHDEEGRLIGAVNVLVDISDRKQAETVLREAGRAKDAFLATLAHELRNPLAPMQNAIGILKRTIDLPADSAAANALGVLERQLAYQTRMVGDLIDLSRITRNELELRVESIDLRAVLREVVDASTALMERERLVLEVDLPEDPIILDADPMRLSQVFANLLNNAAKYTPEGGNVRLAARREGSDAVVAVRDSGQGIGPELLPHIFDMFMRGGPATRVGYDGLGVGLTLARQIVELHGGLIEALSSGPGAGSEFRVRLPVAVDVPSLRSDAPAAAGAAPVAGGAAVSPVLVVDDNLDAAESLRDLLRVMGCEAEMTHDGPSAIEVAERMRPAVILLDIGLPGMNGYEVASRLRATDWGSRVYLAALTGWGQEDDRQRSAEAGFDRHLVKPVGWAEIEGLLGAAAEAAAG